MENRFKVLDGWRGVSISLVLAGHLLPLGIKRWQMNGAVAATGMVLFFILSGFLITNILVKDNDIKSFLIRRVMRIFPLAWSVLAVTLFLKDASSHQWFSSFLFYANWPPMGLMDITSHYWSLCVEVQFYFLIAMLVYLLKEKSFWLIPIFSVFITLFRMSNGVEMAINTYYRIDEILAGCILALIYHSDFSNVKSFIGKLNPFLLFALLIFSAHPLSGVTNYFRPYIAMLLVGSTLFSDSSWKFDFLLKNRFLFYLASISFALYIFHGVLVDTCLGDGGKFVKYLKRPLLFGVTFLLAHLSTHYFEKYWLDIGKKITSNLRL
ncbi:acyltransferase family protein [Desulfogranum mediterraneum]|uniref:acyltransferase family protein n=1 Tax=Desulfogranum mediterraneum TaxID=160661 RepID=UPI00048D3FA4|nr:acyltransferase [Desulfogranum mediterraneum]